MRACSCWLGRFAALLAALTVCGGHWAALQSVAWTNMLVCYSQKEPLREAIAKTFDGAHPCSLCHAVSAGNKSEKKADQQTFSTIEMVLPNAIAKVSPPAAQDRQFVREDFLVQKRPIAPPSPPPRGLQS
jgi:hypothetical protein